MRPQAAHGISIVSSAFFSLVILYFFFATGEGHASSNLTGLFAPARVGNNLVWLVMWQCFTQFPAASMSQFTRGRRAWAALDIAARFLPIVMLVIVAARPSASHLGARWEIWLQLVTLSVGIFIISIVLTLIANQRTGQMQIDAS